VLAVVLGLALVPGQVMAPVLTLHSCLKSRQLLV